MVIKSRTLTVPHGSRRQAGVGGSFKRGGDVPEVGTE